MSSMTLKQFMTRGMEKRGADFLLQDGRLVFNPDPNLRRGTDPHSLEKQLLGQYILRRGTAEGVNNIANQAQGYINNAAQVMGVSNPLVRGLASAANKAVGVASKAYDQHFGGQQFAQSHGKDLMSEAQSLVEYIKSIAFDDAKYKEGLEQVKTVYGSEAAAGLKAKVDGIRNIPGLKWLYETSPDLFNAFADRHIYQSIMSEFGLDPSRVNDYVTGLKGYDMNQYIPGMAAAFGIPLGIGALTGHPGWGLLLGMLGAGAYGYAKYNHIFDKPADVKPEETPAPESPEGLDAPASLEKTEALPASAAEAPAPATEPAPAAEAPSAPSASVSKGISSGGEGDSASTPVASNEDIAAQEQHKLGLDAPDSEIEPSSAPAAQPAAPVVEKKNNPVVQQPTFYPWRVVSKDANGAPVSVWTKKGGPGGTQYTKGKDGKWYLGDGRSWFPKPASPGDVGAIEEAIRSGNYLLDNSIPNLPGNITFMGEDGTVYNNKKEPLGIVRNNKFRSEREKLQPEGMSIDFNSIDDIQDILKPAGDLRVDANGGIFVNNSRVGHVDEDGVVSLWPETLPGTDLSSGKPATYWYDQSDFREAYPDAAWQDSDDRKSYVIRDKNNRLLAYTISKKPDSWVGVFPKYVDLWGLGTELTTQPPTEAPARPEAPPSATAPTSTVPKPPAHPASTTPAVVSPPQPTAQPVASENVVRVKPRKIPSSGPKKPRKDIVIEVPPHQETKKDEGPGLYPRNGFAVPPLSFS